MDPQERHYNINKLNVIFAISSIVLLGSIMWLFVKDYAREWKSYQQQFRTLEVEKARVKIDQENIKLEGDSEYQSLLADLKKARQDFESKCTNLTDDETELEELKAAEDLSGQKYKFMKAELDAAKYRFEEARANHKSNLSVYEDELNNLIKDVGKLKLIAENSTQALKKKEAELKECGTQLTTLEEQEREIVGRKEILNRKLSKIDPHKMTVANQIADMVRNQPIIDLANPNLKIKQIVLGDIRDDVNFMSVPKVDRCITCHLGISNPDYQNAAQPFKTHPNLDLFISKDSAHPMEEFGCSVCHGGRGRGTDFIGTAHTPSSPMQTKEWQKKYNWEKVTHWQEPMYPLPYTEAGCFKCHSAQPTVKGAEKLNLGLQLIEKSGCYNCHDIKSYKSWPKVGPNLTKIATKLSKDWAYKWINNPHAFRHNSRMPAFFNQSNNSDPTMVERTKQEIHAMVHYLFALSDEYPMDKMPYTGNPKKGEELVKSLGCFACHQIQPEAIEKKTTKDSLRRQHGPNLIGLGSKTSKNWLFNWLRNPPSYHPDTRMPNMRLTKKEAAHIVEFLSKDKNDEFDGTPVPEINENSLDDIALEFLTGIHTNIQSSEQLTAMTLDEKLQYTGEKLIGHYGCYSCHEIKGFEGRKPIGTDLTEEGSKDIHNLDFGFIHDIDHTKQAWFKQKLLDPRIFDKGKELAPLEILRMPNYDFTEQEADAIVTALLGFVEDHTIEAKKYPSTPKNILNCQSCHNIDGDGGTIQETIAEWLVKYQGRSENDAEKVTASFSPPNLLGVGAKLNPEWLFEFLHNPSQQVRPWLKVRMPTFTFNASHLNALVTYFNYMDDEEFPFMDIVDTDLSRKEYAAAEELFGTDVFQCTLCHVVGDQLPSGEQESWAPNLALAKTRLKPQWMINWIKNPTALMPGTNMPTFFDPDDFDNAGPPDILGGDENEQIRVLRNYLLTLTDQPKKSKRKKEAPPEVIATPEEDTSDNLSETEPKE